MTIIEQNTILLNDILNRNYYQFFKNNKKSLSLTFFYNLKYTNLKYIKSFKIPVSDINKVKTNFINILDWYVSNQFCCDIKIQDEFWLYDLEFSNFIFTTFLDYIKNKNLKCKNIIIKTKLNSILNNLISFEEIVNTFKTLKVNLIFYPETDLISLGQRDIIKDTVLSSFILNNNFILKVVVNPNNFARFNQLIFDLLPIYNNNLYIYEESNYGWTDYKNKEYFEFLDNYIDYLDKKYSNKLIENLLNNKISLFSLKDKGILDGSGKCTGECSFYNSLSILLEDLSINLCPKFQFDDQVIGNYILENDHLIAAPKHIELISMNVHLKRHSTPHCETCLLLPFCSGCCCKSSYDICLNPIIPVRQFCEMQNQKYGFLFKKLQEKNIISKEIISTLNISNSYKNYLYNLIQQEENNNDY